MLMHNHTEILQKQIPPQWQLDMAMWVNKRMIFCTTDFKDFFPRKGFKCEKYITEYTTKH